MSEIIINSLSEYINEIEKFPSYKYFYRGESKKYSNRNASGLRYYKGSFEDTKEYPFRKMLDDFYREILPVVSTLEHENFIAFAQHHGIPTQLIDITKSPLVALYFACQNTTEENKKENKNGYVYLFKDNYIDITKIVQKYPNKNILEELFINNDKDFLILLPLLEEYYKLYKNDFDIYLETLLKDYKYYFDISLDDTENKLLEEIGKKEPDLWMVLHYLKELDEVELLYSLGDYSIEVFVYLMLMRSFFKQAYIYGKPIWWINFLPNMLYRPIMKFDRGQSQSGLFFYQAYASYIESAYDFRVQMVQRIRSHESVIVIKNKKEILRSLDNIGINQMEIFKDFDNTASYIKSKYEELYGFK